MFLIKSQKNRWKKILKKTVRKKNKGGSWKKKELLLDEEIKNKNLILKMLI